MKNINVSILYKYHSSQLSVVEQYDCIMVSILYKYHSSLDSYHQTLLLLKCRSFISIIVPWLCRTIKMHKDGRCRSFISIIVPLNKMKLSSTQDIVSILYKYHSSLKLLKLITLIFYTSVDPL